MSFSVLSPWMLLGLALVAGPLIAHLTGQREGPRVRYPSLRFLRAAAHRVRRRTRVENLLLLLLRSLAIAALALLFARPWISWRGYTAAGIDPDADTVVLLDRSMSMGRRAGEGTAFDAARRKAREALGDLGGGRAALVFFDGAAQLVPPGLTHDRNPLLRALERAEPGHGTTDLGTALLRARDLLSEAGATRATLLVLGDGTATEPLPDLREGWPTGYAVRYVDLSQGPAANRWFDGVEVTPGERRGEAARVDARISWTGEAMAGEAPISLRVDGLDPLRATASLSPPGPAARRFTLVEVPEGQRSARLALEPPDGVLAADDERCFFLDGQASLKVRMVSGDPAPSPRDDELYYVENAFLPRSGSASRVTPEPIPPADLATLKGGRGRVLVLADLADPTPYAAAIRAFVRDGGGLLVSVGDQVRPEAWNEALGDVLPARLAGVKELGERTFEQSPLSFATPDLDSPVFEVFRDGGAGVFGKVRFGRVMGIEPELPVGARVGLRYSDGRPALVERAVGEGVVILFTATLDDDWTDFPLRSVFVPTLHQLARHLSGDLPRGEGASVEVGQAAPVSVPPGPGRLAVVRPDGREDPLDAEAADARGVVAYRDTDRPGLYRATWRPEGGSEEPREVSAFCVDPPVAESALRPLSREEAMARVPGLEWSGQGEARRKAEAGAQVVKRASLAPWLASLLLIALLAEAALVARRAR